MSAVSRANVAALIPAYLEEKHIAEVVRRVASHLDTVLVVDDGSRDATEAKAREAGAEVIRHTINQGKGAAIKTGLREIFSRGAFEYALLLDGDGQHLPEEIPAFLDEATRSGSRLIVGNRMSDTATMPFVRRATNHFMSSQISSVCGQRIPDTQCGFRMIHRELGAALIDCPSSRYDFETEMLAIAARRGCRIESVPVSTVYGDETSKIHPVQDTIRFIKLMRRLQRQAADAK